MISYLESVISGERRGLFPAILRIKLALISWIYLGIVKLRRWLYSKDILHGKRLPCKVISIGSIVAGGSGKTPAVMAIVRMLKEHASLNIAVLSRGYRGEVQGTAVVSDGKSIFLTADEAGDEPHLLGRGLPGVPILTGKDRFQTGLKAIREWDSEIVVLDDGFQHLKLARDVDIITIDATRPFGLDYLLPRGYLREPLSALNQADLMLLTKVDQCKHLELLRYRLTRIAPSVPIFESIHEPSFLRSLNTDEEIELVAIRGRNVLAVCGIANPMSFAETLQRLGPEKLSLLRFPDHHAYPPRSIEEIGSEAARSNVDIIVTTEKDAPKLNAIADYPVLSLIVELKLVGHKAREFAELVRVLLDDQL